MCSYTSLSTCYASFLTPKQHQSRLGYIGSVFLFALNMILFTQRNALPKQTAKQLISLSFAPFPSLFGSHEILQLLLNSIPQSASLACFGVDDLFRLGFPSDLPWSLDNKLGGAAVGVVGTALLKELFQH
jgi:hypothetical protein